MAKISKRFVVLTEVVAGGCLETEEREGLSRTGSEDEEAGEDVDSCKDKTRFQFKHARTASDSRALLGTGKAFSMRLRMVGVQWLSR